MFSSAEPDDVVRFRSFGFVSDFELHIFAFTEKPVARHFNLRKVAKIVFAVHPSYKAKALPVAKPFHDTRYSHGNLVL